MRTTLFKMDARGQIREWTCWVENHQSFSYIFIRHGANGHQMVIDKVKIDCPAHEEQANFESKSRINKQRDRKGYTEEIPTCRPFKPMLLKRYAENKEHVPPYCYIQPKLNGERCMGSSTWMKSRELSQISCLPHIKEALSVLPPEIVLDGELYCHGMPLQTLLGYCKRDDPLPGFEKISYYVYDIIDESLQFSAREDYLHEFFTEYFPSTADNQPHLDGQSLPPIRRLNTLKINSEEIDTHYNFFLKHGYEGAVIRNPYSIYQCNVRSPGILKYKPVEVLNCLCVDVVPCKNAPKQAKFILRAPNRRTFACSIKGNHAYREKLLNRPDIALGKLVRIEFEMFSEEEIPLKAVAVEIL